ncbi:unnamed protein product, partial [Amoebophrya sp. A25]|eukprot:GSA25T00015322001.1
MNMSQPSGYNLQMPATAPGPTGGQQPQQTEGQRGADEAFRQLQQRLATGPTAAATMHPAMQKHVQQQQQQQPQSSSTFQHFGLPGARTGSFHFLPSG